MALAALMSRPPTDTCPEVACNRPPAMDNNVVLPEPEGPTSATISVAATVRSARASAVTAVGPSP